jgi:hypothetical protein
MSCAEEKSSPRPACGIGQRPCQKAYPRPDEKGDVFKRRLGNERQLMASLLREVLRKGVRRRSSSKRVLLRVGNAVQVVAMMAVPVVLLVHSTVVLV